MKKNLPEIRVGRYLKFDLKSGTQVRGRLAFISEESLQLECVTIMGDEFHTESCDWAMVISDFIEPDSVESEKNSGTMN